MGTNSVWVGLANKAVYAQKAKSTKLVKVSGRKTFADHAAEPGYMMHVVMDAISKNGYYGLHGVPTPSDVAAMPDKGNVVWSTFRPHTKQSEEVHVPSSPGGLHNLEVQDTAVVVGADGTFYSGVTLCAKKDDEGEDDEGEDDEGEDDEGEEGDDEMWKETVAPPCSHCYLKRTTLEGVQGYVIAGLMLVHPKRLVGAPVYVSWYGNHEFREWAMAQLRMPVADDDE
ncbi:hypothetical protein HYH02_015188 [Chlamydomonas schloesseri]|uniref:Uncharacterized protein n=1 Tax=Chlamydomonas schloesseri TaxID=2026947 RepID=A0A835SCA2_9CHLO|nr:hypothetical protein HYH02_015188 [Chlamydomonas schloesseri]|eukprot:KAG2424329.1 hypothetical protein HYH02_015188 [Chlamydomonas schloesseri]